MLVLIAKGFQRYNPVFEGRKKKKKPFSLGIAKNHL
jgi:hypothetical protein